MAEQIIYLRPGEVVQERPFTDPGHIAGDLNSLRYLTDQLSLLLETPHLYEHLPRPIKVHKPESRKEWVYRIVIAQPEKLMGQGELIFVGFLGQRKAEADRAAANEFDEILVGEIPGNPGLLSYSTMGLISGNFSNLVLFTDLEAKMQWSRSKAHARAVNRLSPEFYNSVRLYNGVLPRGITDSNTMELTRIKYFDYRDNPWWRAERVYEGEVQA